MNSLRSIIIGIGVLLGSGTLHAADIALDSACDFDGIELTLRQEGTAEQDVVRLNVTLKPAARARMAATSRARLDQSMTVSINGTELPAVTVRSILDGTGISFAIERARAAALLPSLLVTHCARQRAD